VIWQHCLFSLFVLAANNFTRFLHVAECGSENHLGAKDPVRCRECGYRIMYKKRARRRTIFLKICLG
jgi:DNA-directed RNA polymerase subunit RPC12/RpoP